MNKLTKSGLITASITLILFSTDVLAANAGETAEHITGQVDGMKQLMMALFYLMGVIAAGLGVWGVKKEFAQPGQDHGKKGAISFIVGCVLLSLGWMIDTTQSSLDSGSAGGSLNNDFSNNTTY